MGSGLTMILLRLNPHGQARPSQVIIGAVHPMRGVGVTDSTMVRGSL